MASHYHCITGEPRVILPNLSTGLLTDGIPEQSQGLTADMNMTPPTVIQAASTSVIKPVMHPHMLNINTTGTSGFRSPSIPPCVNSQPNVTFPSLNVSQVCVPFPSDTATSGYQFPSPSSAGGVQPINSGVVPESVQPHNETLTWPGLELWNNPTW